MIFAATRLNDAVIIDVERHGDERGYLARTFCEEEFADHGLATRFVQSSTIVSPRRHTLRGLHYQRAPHREVKLVRCIRGAARVTIVDLRPESPSYIQWLGVELSQDNGRLLYVPEGCAQGYQTLADDTEVLYQMTHHYVPDAATGVRWDDPAFGIEWPPAAERIISARDGAWPDYEVSPPKPATASAAAPLAG
ncbi:MAG TPA: dTDP-4-dehydrorhamnose 3,5-epimerase [Solirubrobacteraceae bacterium]